MWFKLRSNQIASTWSTLALPCTYLTFSVSIHYRLLFKENKQLACSFI